MQNDNMTQPVEECDDYRCEKCGETYTGDDWRELGALMVCPECAECAERADNDNQHPA